MPQHKYGEWLVARSLKNRLDTEVYKVLNNVMIPDQAGGTTQIDHVVFSPFGVFVIETKNMKGWIFGNANSTTWTQTIYRSKHKFQNPFRQNYKHVKCLAELTGLDERHLIHVIVFIGNCAVLPRVPTPAINSGAAPIIPNAKVSATSNKPSTVPTLPQANDKF